MSDKIRINATVNGSGKQIFRFAQPFEDGWTSDEKHIHLLKGETEIPVSVRVLTRYPSSDCPRTALITFTDEAGKNDYSIVCGTESRANLCDLDAGIEIDLQKVSVTFASGTSVNAALILPDIGTITGEAEETVEKNAFCVWKRKTYAGEKYSVTVDVRAFADETVVGLCFLQQNGGKDGYTPEYGWEISAAAPVILPRTVNNENKHSFIDRDYSASDGTRQVYFPIAHAQKAGHVSLKGNNIKYIRATLDDRVPMQPYTYRRAAFVSAPKSSVRLDETLRFPVHIEGNSERFRKLLYEYEPLYEGACSERIQSVIDKVRQSSLAISIDGDDLGNVTYLDADTCTGKVFGINRMNHMGDYFLYGLCGDDDDLLKRARLWAQNYNDLTVWWGPDGYGGTRYPLINTGWGGADINQIPYTGKEYMWRANEPISFSHKGFAHFYTAYAVTGEPELLYACKAQTEYAMTDVHVDTSLTRNVGVARDFALMYVWTGDERYKEKAVSLFKELTGFTNDEGLFSENGMFVDGNEGFINDDPTGYKYGFAKPYIIGYGTEGLTILRRVAGKIEGLDETIIGIARFLARTLDACGTMRYPHPYSGYTHLTLEAGQHIMRAIENVPDILESDKEAFLDAIEAMLKLTIMANEELGYIGVAISAWEVAQGLCSQQELYNYYDKPDQRDRNRDFDEGGICEHIILQSEGFMPFFELLSCYARYRDLRELEAEPSGQLLKLRNLIRKHKAKSAYEYHEKPGVICGNWIEKFPAFMPELKRSLPYSLARRNNLSTPFAEWKCRAKDEVVNSYAYFKAADEYKPALIAQEDRGTYTCQKILLNTSAFSRVSAYILVPNGKGPFPAMVLYHDHGAKFDIGKEKMIRPFDEEPAVIDSAQKWVDECYDGSFIGDELAKRGYVCFCTDALNWSERSASRDYLYNLPSVNLHGNDSHILDSNMSFLGASHAGWIAYEDLAAAEFVSKLPYVDSERVGAIGLSMGAYRTWQAAAISPYIKAAVAICWMCQTRWLTLNGVNHAGGNNNAMLHCGLYSKLDIPDVASLVCPKPMLLYNGLKDTLFPVPSVRACYHIIRDVYEEQGAADRLVTELWDVPHTFNRQMQDKAFEWLDSVMKENQTTEGE